MKDTILLAQEIDPATPVPRPSTLSTKPSLHPVPGTPGSRPSALSTESSLHPVPGTPGSRPSALSTEPSLHLIHHYLFTGMCLMKISLDYIPSAAKLKRYFLGAAALCFMLIGAFLFGLVAVQSVMDDVKPETHNSPVISSCFSK